LTILSLKEKTQGQDVYPAFKTYKRETVTNLQTFIDDYRWGNLNYGQKQGNSVSVVK
jgi:hypothetical protein